MTQYIRFGDIPQDEQSEIYQHGELVGKEIGVSVYGSKIEDDRISVCLPLPMTKDTLGTFQQLVEYDSRPCYLVEGDLVGYGSDNEPLIRNVKIIKEIQYRTKK